MDGPRTRSSPTVASVCVAGSTILASTCAYGLPTAPDAPLPYGWKVPDPAVSVMPQATAGFSPTPFSRSKRVSGTGAPPTTGSRRLVKS